MKKNQLQKEKNRQRGAEIRASEATRSPGQVIKSQIVKAVFPTVIWLPHWATPIPKVLTSFNLSLMVQAPPAEAGAPAPKKEKGNQAEALRSRAEPSASLYPILEPGCTKHHINQNAEAKAFHRRMRHSGRPSPVFEIGFLD